jgi:hypothetical protein
MGSRRRPRALGGEGCVGVAAGRAGVDAELGSVSSIVPSGATRAVSTRGTVRPSRLRALLAVATAALAVASLRITSSLATMGAVSPR